MTIQWITRDDLTITHSISSRDSAVARVVINADGPLNDEIFHLRSTQGMADDSGYVISLDNGGGIHVYSGAMNDNWHGAFQTYDMDEAVDLFVVYINDWNVRMHVQDETYMEVHVLNDAIRSFMAPFDGVHNQDIHADLHKMQSAIVAITMKMRSAVGE